MIAYEAVSSRENDYTLPVLTGATENYMRHQILVIATILLVLLVEAAAQNYPKLPMHFESTQAETNRPPTFQSRAAAYAVSIAPDRTVLVLAGAPHSSSRSSKTLPVSPKAQPTIVGMRLVGANARANMVGLRELKAKSNYYLGNDPAKWRIGISHYEKVQCKDIYPGIDLVYYGNPDQLEFDFVVSPGANPEVVRLTFEGAEGIRVDENRDLVLHTSDREVRLRTPITYQVRNGQRRVIAAQYEITGENEVSLQVAAYDKSSPLIIDPVLSYSTYLGGSDNDFGLNIATDNAGNAYVSGFTLSLDFPLKGDSLLNTQHGGVDAFVSKFGPTGALLYSTYLGGERRRLWPEYRSRLLTKYLCDRADLFDRFSGKKRSAVFFGGWIGCVRHPAESVRGAGLFHLPRWQ
jgi:Beta-propeller repeat